MPKALVIGLGMGQQYRTWLTELGYAVDTVDSNADRNATYQSVDAALVNNRYDIVYVGTPNFTHQAISEQVVDHCRLLLVEKPGFETAAQWQHFVNKNSQTRIMMVKNNQYRLEHSGWRSLASVSTKVTVAWLRTQGVPESSWFKDKKLAWGGVGRDLMPHMLSYYTRLADRHLTFELSAESRDCIDLGVDTEASMNFANGKTLWKLMVDWNTGQSPDQCYIEFETYLGNFKFDLGRLCPADPYKLMITTAVDNIDNDVFWYDQADEDVWIHRQLERL